LGGTTEDGLRRFLARCGASESLAPVIASGTVDAADLLSSLAGQAVERRASEENSRAAAAGARLSGRMVAGLPLLFIPFAPAAKAPVWDSESLILLAAGMLMSLIGLRWIDRFLPPIPQPDPAGTFAELTAALLRGGAGIAQALGVAATSREREDPDVGRVRRRFLLGASWEAALASCRDPGYKTLAAIVKRGRTLGLDIAVDLEGFARARRAQRHALFDAEIRKAPVKMVIPLVTCVLPAFVIVSFGPFFRTLM
jgi:Flp pilus assembly protein TadB